ncbi:MAG: hypothetical protein H0W08_25130 [Acidobacteria bacterium]|nr:hypothetical protein [Acidobacteriota bacterium]
MAKALAFYGAMAVIGVLAYFRLEGEIRTPVVYGVLGLSLLSSAIASYLGRRTPPASLAGTTRT